MPMSVWAVALYLGIVYAGCAVVGIADSFAPKVGFSHYPESHRLRM